MCKCNITIQHELEASVGCIHDLTDSRHIIEYGQEFLPKFEGRNPPLL